jgi:hypothetical protein
MPTNKPRVYFDSCGYIDVAKGRHGVSDEHSQAELPFLEGLLLAAHDGLIEIWTSSITIAECLTIEASVDEVPEAVRETFRSLLMGGSPVRINAADVFVAEKARDLRWQGIRCGGGADGLHVATALDLGCEEFITTNSKRGPLQGETPARLAKLGLRVIRPHQTTVLPPQYRPKELLS